MLACVIPTFGDPSVLELRDVPTPVPGPHQVVVRVRATALNRADLLQRAGRYPPPNDAPRDIPGIEFAGEVAVLGEGASRWHLGERVFAIVGGGAHAEFVVAHEDTLVRIPPPLSFTEAAAIPEAFMTAHDALVTQAALAPGERVLIHAVGSGVGLAAAQIVAAWGGTAYGTSRTADKLERSRAFGMTDGIVLRESLEPLGTAVAGWTGGRGVEVVLDLVGGPYLAASIDAAALKGRVMLVGTVGGPRATVEVGRILAKRLTLKGTVLRSRSLDEKVAVAAAFARDIVPRLAARELRPTIDRILPLAGIADAHRRVESNESFGKVVIEVA